MEPYLSATVPNARGRLFVILAAGLILVSLPDIGRPAQDSSVRELDRANQIQQTISASEWLGPLSPIALSPFFGLTILSGLATFGQEQITAANGLLSADTPLRNPAVFWVFLALTIFTSLPKLTKVSKALAQSIDWLETYSTVIALIVIRVAAAQAGNRPEEVAIYSAGIGTMTVDTLMMIAMAVNIIVVNGVKFFFEMLIWITPVPFLDATFEVANKTACALLMTLYIFNPTLATALNLVILAACLLVFSWVQRRTLFYRSMVFDLIAAAVWKPWRRPKHQLTVFPEANLSDFKAKARCTFTRSTDGWLIRQPRFLRPTLSMELTTQPTIEIGLLYNRLVTDQGALLFSRRFNADLDQLASQLAVSIVESPAETNLGLA